MWYPCLQMAVPLKAGGSPPGYDDILAYHQILSLVEQSVAKYNTIAGDVRAHQDRIAMERAALGALHTRLVGMHKTLKGWEAQVWDMRIRNVGPREARQNAKELLNRRLDHLIWQLRDFTENVE